MPLQIGIATGDGKRALMAVSQEQNILDPLSLMRLLRKEFPAEWQQVNYEIHVANGARLELPEDIEVK